MPWGALLRARAEARYKTLVVRFEDTDEPGWLVCLYDSGRRVAEALAEDPRTAIARILPAAREYLNDPGICAEDFVWVQM